MRAGSARRCAPKTSMARRSPSPALGIPRREPAPSARRSRSCSAPATSSATTRSWCGPRSRCANSKIASSPSACPTASSAAQDSTSAPKSATRWRICASSTRPPTTSLSSASSMCRSAGAMKSPEGRGRGARGAWPPLIVGFDRWRAQSEVSSHTELAEVVLDESGYTEMWQKDRSADAAGRLENLKELVRSMEEFENLQGFLEHISLVMDRDGGTEDDAVSLMTLHSAKGLEFDNVFLPGWEEGLFPSQRTLDEQGRAGLEEERRLAHVGLTRARRRAKLYFATNRRIHGTWSTTIPSRFLDELPAPNVEITESKGGSGWGGSGGYGPSRFDNVESFGSSYTTPGWQRAQANRARHQARRNGQEGGFDESQSPFSSRDTAGFSRKRAPLTIEGELVAKSTGATSEFSLDDRVFHQKFGYGQVVKIDGNKLTFAFA